MFIISLTFHIVIGSFQICVSQGRRIYFFQLWWLVRLRSLLSLGADRFGNVRWGRIDYARWWQDGLWAPNTYDDVYGDSEVQPSVTDMLIGIGYNWWIHRYCINGLLEVEWLTLIPCGKGSGWITANWSSVLGFGFMYRDCQLLAAYLCLVFFIFISHAVLMFIF